MELVYSLKSFNSSLYINNGAVKARRAVQLVKCRAATDEQWEQNQPPNEKEDDEVKPLELCWVVCEEDEVNARGIRKTTTETTEDNN